MSQETMAILIWGVMIYGAVFIQGNRICDKLDKLIETKEPRVALETKEKA